MNKEEMIGRLGALLARVRTRGAEPRRPFGAPRVPSPDLLGDGPLAAVAAAQASPELEILPETEVLFAADLEEATRTPVNTEAPAATSLLDEPFLGSLSDSRERLVAAEPLAEPPAAPAPVSDGPPDSLTPELNGVAEDDAVEAAPVSSRRPVAAEPEERLAELAFGAEELQPPRHTPPPESGQLLAVSELEFERDITGVRDSSPVALHRSEEAAAADLGRRTVALVLEEPAPARELMAEVMRPEIAASERVVDVLGEAQRFAPTTFLALLEASLNL